MESLLHDVVEHILERVPLKSLLRFEAVSKQWKSTITSRYFQQRLLTIRQQTGDPDILMVSVFPYDVCISDIEALRTLELGSASSVKIPTSWENNTLYLPSFDSCDGLVCLYETLNFSYGIVVNPTTRWYRRLPLSEYQQLVTLLGDSYHDLGHEHFKLGFGKDKINGTYKPVWLYNSSEISLENATTCEVFDFSTNAWRYVTPSCPYRIFGCPYPVYLDGSLHWFTACEETKIVSFDLHTEVFQVKAKAPFANVHRFNIVMCNLDNRLCVSEMKWPTQVIWSFSSGNKTWDKMYSIDLEVTSSWFGRHGFALQPLALIDWEKKKKKKKNKKKKLLFYDRELSKTLVIHDPETKSYDVAFSAEAIGYPICYFQSLVSII